MRLYHSPGRELKVSLSKHAPPAGPTRHLLRFIFLYEASPGKYIKASVFCFSILIFPSLPCFLDSITWSTPKTFTILNAHLRVNWLSCVKTFCKGTSSRFTKKETFSSSRCPPPPNRQQNYERDFHKTFLQISGQLNIDQLNSPLQMQPLSFYFAIEIDRAAAPKHGS